jgi:hypothetical protein
MQQRKVADCGIGIWNLEFGISSPPSRPERKRNSKFQIPNSKSAIRNLSNLRVILSSAKRLESLSIIKTATARRIAFPRWRVN